MSNSLGSGPPVPSRVQVGFFAFTEVPDGDHREHEELHPVDHVLGDVRLEGTWWARRWVATPELMERRLFARDDLAKSQRVSLYLSSEPVTAALDKFQELGRFFQARRSPL